jgi:hypothetical protein
MTIRQRAPSGAAQAIQPPPWVRLRAPGAAATSESALALAGSDAAAASANAASVPAVTVLARVAMALKRMGHTSVAV